MHPRVRQLVSGLALMLLLASAPAQAARELGWEDLMPKDLTLEKMQKGVKPNPASPFGMSFDPKIFAPVKALDRTEVKLPGYVLPLQFEGTAVTEFLLVPYVGACIHAPPPPPNQIVYVKTKKPFETKGLFTPVWVTGEIRIDLGERLLAMTDGSDNVLVGYSLDARAIEPYEAPKGKGR